MELRQLEYVVAVADELHFGRAAERLRVAQQTVSEQVARLERELGARVFERTSRSVRLTEVGEAFVPEARRVLAQVEHARDVGRRAAGASPALRFGYPPNSGRDLTLRVLPGLARRAPAARLLPVPGYTVELVTALLDERTDLALAWHPDVPEPLHGVPLFSVPVALALPDDDPLASFDRVPRAALRGRPLVMLVPRSVHPALHDHLLAQLSDGSGSAPRIVAEAPSTDRLLPLVVAGVGVGVTFTSLADDEHTHGVLHRRLTDPEPVSTCWLLWRRVERRPGVLEVVEALRALAAEGSLDP
ncbi:MAG: LysR family transcriptional regulator [Dermatophilaceae bacterium]